MLLKSSLSFCLILALSGCVGSTVSAVGQDKPSASAWRANKVENAEQAAPTPTTALTPPIDTSVVAPAPKRKPDAKAAPAKPAAVKPRQSSSASVAVLAAAKPAAPATIAPGTLQSGYKVWLVVENDPSLSGPLLINSTGQIKLPLAGPITIAGLTPTEAVAAIRAAYADGFFIDPKVRLEVLEPGHTGSAP